MANKVDMFCKLLMTTINKQGLREVSNNINCTIDPYIRSIYYNNKYHNATGSLQRASNDSLHHKLTLLFKEYLQDPFHDKSYDIALNDIIMHGENISKFLAGCSNLGNLLGSDLVNSNQIAFSKKFEILLDEYIILLENYFAEEEKKKNINKVACSII